MLSELNGTHNEEENFDDPNVMDPVDPVKPRRTRAPNKAKDAGDVKAQGGAYYLLINKAGQVVTHTADPAEVRKAAAQAILDPECTLYRAEVVTPDSVFQK